MIRNLFSRSNSNNNSSDVNSPKQRRAAVVPQHFVYNQEILKTVTKYPKTREDEIFIKSALENNDFLCSLLQNKNLQNIINCLYPKEVEANQVIIEQCESGSHLFISIKGTYDVVINGEVINSFSDVRVFGELALLYNVKRLATVKARTWGKLWVLDQVIFKNFMISSEIERRNELVTFLEKVPKLNMVDVEVLEEVANLLQSKYFPPGTEIVKEGDRVPDKFYIIRAGSVTVSKQNEGPIDKLYTGNFFGELALLDEAERKATVTADPPGTECLILTRQEFINNFGNIPDCFSINLQVQPYKPMEKILEHAELTLDDFNRIAVIGRGGFAKVELVQHKTRKELVFALKCVIKESIISRGCQENIFNEKEIQMTCKSDFIVRLYRTFKDTKFLYLLLEPCLGGDLWSLIHKQKNNRFEEPQAKFYTGCVIEALCYLHERHMIYRDLKPENLLISARGYIKLTDFGFARKLYLRKRTYSFVGTPEYIPPEVILNQGYDKAFDIWALGVFIFELLSGRTPFYTTDPTHMKTYKLILSGMKDIVFPHYVTPEAENLVKMLSKANPSERLGYGSGGFEDVRNHKWFEDFDWTKLKTGELQAPFRPNLKNNVDLHYFEKMQIDDDEVPRDINYDWEEDF